MAGWLNSHIKDSSTSGVSCDQIRGHRLIKLCQMYVRKSKIITKQESWFPACKTAADVIINTWPFQNKNGENHESHTGVTSAYLGEHEHKRFRLDTHSNLFRTSYKQWTNVTNVVIQELYCCVEISKPLVCGRELVVCSLQEGRPLSSPPVVREICVCVCVCELMNVLSGSPFMPALCLLRWMQMCIRTFLLKRRGVPNVSFNVLMFVNTYACFRSLKGSFISYV